LFIDQDLLVAGATVTGVLEGDELRVGKLLVVVEEELASGGGDQ
jgi:hypothetical protein